MQLGIVLNSIERFVLQSIQFMRKWFISVNNMKLDACKKIIAEWLEEQVPFAPIRRRAEPMELENLSGIPAVEGPGGGGNPLFMYQLIRALWGRLA
jgi:hypothetical protein